MAASACNQCVFGAVSTSLLSYPIAVGTVDIQVIPHVTFASNGSASTSFETSTVVAATTPVAGSAAVSTITVTAASQLTWATLGTTLTYPTTYVDYAAFAGAAVTGTGCAQSLSPTILTLGPSAAAASLIYPLGGAGLPPALLNYLDSNGAIPAQLNGDQLTTCGALSGGLPPTASASSVLTVITSVVSSPVTISTNIPPPTTFTSERTSTASSLSTVANSAVSQSTALIFSLNTGGPIFYSGGVSTSLASAQLESLGSSAKSSLSSALSSLSTSKFSLTSTSTTSTQTGIFTNTTSGQTKPATRGTIAPTTSSYKPSSLILPSSSKTSGPALYSGSASRHVANSNSIIADLFGFVAFLLFL